MYIAAEHTTDLKQHHHKPCKVNGSEPSSKTDQTAVMHISSSNRPVFTRFVKDPLNINDTPVQRQAAWANDAVIINHCHKIENWKKTGTENK